MADSAEKKVKTTGLFLRKETLEKFVSFTARSVMNMKERLRQRTEKIIQAVPLFRRLSRKWKVFDGRMEKKHGQVYTKLRDSAKNIARTVLAAELFGLPGVVGICAYKTCEKAMSLLEPAQKAKESGETKGVLDYLKENSEETRFTVTSGAISICTAACDVVGAPLAKGVFRVGKASWLIAPEVKKLAATTEKWLRGEESFVEVKRDAAVAGITFGTFFVSSVPMTRGSGKPKSAEDVKPLDSNDPAEEKIRAALNKGQKYAVQVRKTLENGIASPSVFDIKCKKRGR